MAGEGRRCRENNLPTVADGLQRHGGRRRTSKSMTVFNDTADVDEPRCRWRSSTTAAGDDEPRWRWSTRMTERRMTTTIADDDHDWWWWTSMSMTDVDGPHWWWSLLMMNEDGGCWWRSLMMMSHDDDDVGKYLQVDDKTTLLRIKFLFIHKLTNFHRPETDSTQP